MGTRKGAAMQRTISATLLVLAVATILVACGDSSLPAATPTGSGVQPSVVAAATTGRTVAGIRARMYNSIQELLRDSAAVVRVTAVNATTEVGPTVVLPTVGITVEGSNYTITTVRVNEVLYGSVSGPEIKVRQNGARGTNVITTDTGPLMEAGKSYVLFLERAIGSVPFDYIVTGGGPGLYTDEGGMLGKTDPASPNLPAMLSLPDLQRTISMGVPSAVATIRPGSPSSVPSAVTTAVPVLPPTPSR